MRLRPLCLAMFVTSVGLILATGLHERLSATAAQGQTEAKAILQRIAREGTANSQLSFVAEVLMDVSVHV